MPNNRICVLLILFTTIFSSALSLAQAPQCFSVAPVNRTTFTQISTTPLNNAAQQQLLKLLETFNGQWNGNTQGFFCSSSKNKAEYTEDNYELSAEATLQRDKRAGTTARFDFNVTFESDRRKSIDQDVGFRHEPLINEQIQYNLKDGILYTGLRQSNPMIIKNLRNKGVTLIESFPSRLKSGATTQRVIVRHITVLGERNIQIENQYYTHDKLFSLSRWNLRR